MGCGEGGSFITGRRGNKEKALLLNFVIYFRHFLLFDVQYIIIGDTIKEIIFNKR